MDLNLYFIPTLKAKSKSQVKVMQNIFTYLKIWSKYIYGVYENLLHWIRQEVNTEI